MSNKALLRKILRQSLAQISQNELNEQSTHIQTQLVQSLKDQPKVEKVAIYLSFDHSEVKTDSIIQSLFLLKKRVFLPKVVTIDEPLEKRYPAQKFKLEFYELKSYSDVQSLQAQGKFKIREPNTGFNIMDDATGFDLILLPGLAFTIDCYRMGHGAGLYDDFIKRHAKRFNKTPYLLGLGLQEQVVKSLPLEEHDEKLDGLIIDDHFYGDPRFIGR